MNLLFFGSRFLPYRHEGDKNFWLMLVETLKRDCEHICIISMNTDCSGDYFEFPNLRIHNVSPLPFPTRQSRFSDHSLKFLNNYGSKSISLLKNLGQVNRIIKEENSHLMHFIDNYGPVMTLLKRKTMPPLSTFAPTYNPNNQFYDHILKASLLPFTKVITTTYAFKRKLVDLGLADDKVDVIRWGVDTNKLKPNRSMMEETREKLGISPCSKVILWSGFLQQIGFRELQYSLKIAEETLKQNNNCTFVFALKNAHFRKEHLNYEKKGIKIVSTKSNSDFLKLVNASDAFLSPILSLNSIVAPPLTWIECMACGVPIIATHAGGSDELVSDGQTGYLFNTTKEASQKIQTILTNENLHKTISEAARKKVCVEYDIRGIANEYLDVWKQMAEWRR